MVEVCQLAQNSMSVLNDNPMKHSSSNIETYEFNLGQALNLRCKNTTKATICGECETCCMNSKLKEARDWLPKLGDNSKKRFMLGLLRRFHSVDLLNQIVTLLQPLLCKDFTYARSRTAPSLSTDIASLSADRALLPKEVDNFIAATWSWFQRANYWTKANYALAMLQLCDSHLLHVLGTQARTLLVSEERASSLMDENDGLEASSIASTEYSFRTDEHPELDLLMMASSKFESPTVNPFTGESLVLFNEIENDDSGDESFTTTDMSSLDPACMVIPTSSKAASGVAKYRDFIRSLPVHIAKYILGYLDTASLHNALCVNSTWRILVNEVHEEFRVNQDLIEEVMLMQGAAAQGANPVYAKDIDVFVPNLYPGTREVIYTEDQVIKAKYKSEVNFETAYSGVSHRKVIMEERNVYCGSYNVMVISTVEDPHRVIHTCGRDLIAIGSKDRKVRFIETQYGNQQGPVITGHAGSIRCVYLCQDRGFVLSGSYDTSVRMWSMETGKCMRIFRGHRDTILTILVCGDYLISGAKDKCCKVWDLNTGKCQRTFKHRYPVWAVAMNNELCITGCEGGRVKVWDIKSGELIKLLSGHHKQVTAIKFDCWHTITSSKDGYALIWSSQGKHNRCLNALRHPDEVLCLEFMYLRIITGCADGRLRIWNMVTGQCCRIMRGNSRSDPIESIVAIRDRITLNTSVNLLVLNFEKVEWDYTLENDKVPPLVQYSSYSDAPIRNLPYSYIRAQRMVKAGATNLKIINRNGLQRSLTEGHIIPQTNFCAPQLPHSAKILSSRSMLSAKDIQTRPMSEGAMRSRMSARGQDIQTAYSEGKFTAGSSIGHQQRITSPSKPPLPKPRPLTHKSAVSQHSVVIADRQNNHDDDDDDDTISPSPSQLKRRISWAFEKPIIPKSKDISLSETKALLRSQLRMKSESVVPPDFIYLTVNAIQASMRPSETNKNTQVNMRDENIHSCQDTLRNRPSSSPPKIDPRTKISPEEMGLERFLHMDDKIDSFSEDVSDIKSIKSMKSNKTNQSKPAGPDKEVFATPCDVKPVKTKIRMSLHSKRTKTTVPVGRLIRPISASASRREPKSSEKGLRPVTAPTLRERPDTAATVPSTIATTLPGAGQKEARIQQQQQYLKSSAHESSIVPMLMYPHDMKEKMLQSIKERRQNKSSDLFIADETGAAVSGKVSQYNDPLRSHVRFELRTFEQEREYLDGIEQQFAEQLRREEEILAKKQKALWLSKAKIRPQSENPRSQTSGKVRSRPASESIQSKARPLSLPPR